MVGDPEITKNGATSLFPATTLYAPLSSTKCQSEKMTVNRLFDVPPFILNQRINPLRIFSLIGADSGTAGTFRLLQPVVDLRLLADFRPDGLSIFNRAVIYGWTVIREYGLDSSQRLREYPMTDPSDWQFPEGHYRSVHSQANKIPRPRGGP
jgi:hypothetical protein